MKLSLPFAYRMSGDLKPVGQQFRRMKAQIKQGWNIQHNLDGTHKNITCEDCTVSDDLAVSGDTTLTGFLSLADAWRLERNAQVDAAAISADQNNYNPTDSLDSAITMNQATIVRLSATGATRTITGLQAPSPLKRRPMLLLNVGAEDIVLAHASGSSTATNQFACPNNANFTLQNNGAVWLLYDMPRTSTGDDTVSGRWRLIVGA